MKNVQITKPANAIAAMVASAPVAAKIVKADAAAKAPRTRRPAQKPVAKSESIVAKSVKVIGVKFTLSTAARPTAGRTLRAYTEAALQLLGMYDGKAHDRATLVNIIGATAIAYHTKATNAFTTTQDGIILTPGYGSDFFKVRAEMKEFDEQDVKDFTTIMTTGKADGRLVKNPAFIKAI